MRGGGPVIPQAIRHSNIHRFVASETISLGDGTWKTDHNVWLVGDVDEVVVIDAAHDVTELVDAIGDRRVVAIVCTHADSDHINAAHALADRTGAPILLHPADFRLWQDACPGRLPDADLADGQVITVSGTGLRILHTPGHTPGSVCIYAPQLGELFSGETLLQGGPGSSCRSPYDFPTMIGSIRDRLLPLPSTTVVRPGQGASTTIGAESVDLQRWINRGY